MTQYQKKVISLLVLILLMVGAGYLLIVGLVGTLCMEPMGFIMVGLGLLVGSHLYRGYTETESL